MGFSQEVTLQISSDLQKTSPPSRFAVVGDTGTPERRRGQLTVRLACRVPDLHRERERERERDIEREREREREGVRFYDFSTISRH